MLISKRWIDRSKREAKALLRSFGLDVRRARDVPPLPPLLDDPLEVIHRRNSHDLVALRCPLSACVELNGMSFSVQGWHPFVQAAAECLDGSERNYRESALEKYYAIWQPANAREALIGADIGPAELELYPAYVRHLPWSSRTIDESEAYMRRVIELENMGSDARELSAFEGYGLHGPVSSAKGELEYRRLLDLVDAMRQEGYDRSKGHVTVEVLVRAGEVRLLLVHGHHRTAAMAALGHTYVPAIPETLIEAEHADHWPGVYKGIWSKEEALRYFDHLFEFDSLRWAEEKKLLLST